MDASASASDVEGLGGGVLRAASNYDALALDKSGGVDRLVYDDACAADAPVYFALGCFEIPQVPDFEPLAAGAPTRNYCELIGVHVNRVTTRLRATDLVRDNLRPHVPKLDRAVPAARQESVPAVGTKFHTENLVRVRLDFTATTDHLHQLVQLIIIDLNLR